MKDKNGKRIDVGMIVRGELLSNAGYYGSDEYGHDESEMVVIVRRGTTIQGEVVKYGNKLCVKIESIVMPYLSMLKKNTREIVGGFTKSSADDFPSESLISVKRESTDSQNSPHDSSTIKEEANFS